jgi:dihydropteroate synthase
VVNLTPDSFFDGGRFMAPDSDDVNVSVVERQCQRWAELGVAVLDLGGESTRPGADPIPAHVELRRVLPVVERLVGNPVLKDVPISIDTRHAAVARECLAAGAAIINDVSGLADPEMVSVAAEHQSGVVIGHLRGKPATMQQHIAFDALLDEVGDELTVGVERAVKAGVTRDRIVVDPGIGFGKTAEQSAALTAGSHALEQRTGCPVMIGVSRKRFLGKITGRPESDRLMASVVAGVVAVHHGARLLRAHDVPETIEALQVAMAIERAWAEHRGQG